jgi:predicted dinucleotide-binding enzyme
LEDFGVAFDPADRLTRRDAMRLAAGSAIAAAFGASPLLAWAQAMPGAGPGAGAGPLPQIPKSTLPASGPLVDPQGGPRNIATIGAGREGGALGTLFAKNGHPVMFSSRHPEQLKDLIAEAGSQAKAGTVEEAIAFGDVVLLVVPYTAVKQIGQDYGAALAKKALVMDVSNPIAKRDGDELIKWVDEQGGAGKATAALLPGARLVRAFNAIGFGKLAELSHRQGEPVGVPIAGDDQNAIVIASRLIKEVGFEPVVVGKLAMGKYLNVGTPLAGVHTPAEIREIMKTLKS